MRRVPRTVWAAVVVPLLLSGCGGLDAREEAAARAALAFETALREADHATACAALAPTTRDELAGAAGLPCVTALADAMPPVAGPVRRTDVYGRQARAVLRGDTLFLAHFPDGWKVTAAGCRPRPKAPYDCSVDGG